MNKAINTRIVESGENNPWYNLALEEYLLQKAGEGEIILYLWQNQNTVVIVRNQNAWKECRYQLLEREGGKLARRLSGGGAVFHDTGNLNFTFIMDKKLYNLEKQLEVILSAVRSLGIEAGFSGRNDLEAGGRKFSGNAFYFSEKTAYHHGTILIDVDFNKLTRYLQVSREKIISKGIDSVRSRVINLKELRPDLNLSMMKKALYRSFLSIYLKEENPEVPEPYLYYPSGMTELRGLYSKYSSWEWIYGKSPQFDMNISKRFDWGGIEFAFSLRNAIIRDLIIYSDVMETELVTLLAESLKGINFNLTDIITAIDSVLESLDRIFYDRIKAERMISDIKNWFKEIM
ncbi:MAG: lipoate--protein ligase [Halanaerobiaceae bacterium]|nr:lipoate--protein ligase [Halanaerobiaceae bacterium]